MVTIPKIPIEQLNSSIRSLTKISNFDQIQNAAAEAEKQLAAATSSVLGVTVNESVGGWQSLTQEIDNIEEGITSVANKGLALLESNPPGVNLVNEFSGGAQSALQSITGLTDEIQTGLNSVVHALPTPEAVASALSDVGSLPLAKLEAAMQEIAPPDLKSLASDAAIGQIVNQEIFRKFENTVSSVNKDIEKFLDNGFGQTIKDVIEATTNPVGFAIDQLTQDVSTLVPKSIRKEVAGLLDKGQFLQGAELLSTFSNLDVTTLETELSQINTSASNLINKNNPKFDAIGVSTAPVTKLGENDGAWAGAETPVKPPASTGTGYTFTHISSKEELEAILRTATREITETVIHWTANYIDQAHIGAEDVHQWHLDRGWSGCGYHFIIKRDGTIQTGRPINITGAHAGNLGHNKFSIGIAHVAGYNCVAGTPNPNSHISAESISEAQWKAQRDFLEVFYRVFPGGQVLGHNQTDTSKTDPGFDVDAYILNTFGKRNALVYNRDKGPLSRAGLIEARRNQGTTV